MKHLLRGERAPTVRALPALSRLEPLRAWARESLVARLLAIALGLGILAAIGSSALAGGAITPGVVAAPMPPVVPVAPAAAVPSPLDAGSAPLPVTPAPSPTAAPPEHAATGSKRATPDDPVDINSATLDDLRRLPGIGQKRASAILAVRARLGGRFRQIEDLLKVKGVGRAALRKLHPLVRLDSPLRSADGGA